MGDQVLHGECTLVAKYIISKNVFVMFYYIQTTSSQIVTSEFEQEEKVSNSLYV